MIHKLRKDALYLFFYVFQTLFFNEIIAEPAGIHSLDCVWKCSWKCFELWKKLCYYIMTTLCGICISMEWGCEFAYIAFYHIWCVTPCMKVLEINCGVCQKIYAMCVNCCLVPLCEACGALFNAFKKN
jgi:hypothetical protein